MGNGLRLAVGLATALLVVVGLAGCGGADGDGGDAGDGGDGGDGGGDGAVAVELDEFSVEADPTSAPAGSVTFAIENVGQAVHEFVVVSTELGSGDLPTTDDGSVDEEAEELTVVDEVEDLAAGDSEELSVALEAGHYALICNLPGHYSQGMHTDFDVE